MRSDGDFMKLRQLFTFVLISILALQLGALPLVFAEESPDALKRVVNTDGTVTVTTTYFATTEAPELPATIMQDGKSYTLDRLTTISDPEYEPPRQTFTRTAFSEVPLQGINNLGAYFPASYPLEEGEYKGEIALDSAHPFTVVERYEAFRTQVDRQTVLYGLPDNDVTQLPTAQNFEVASAAYPGATQVSTLYLLDVRFDVAGTDHLGLPNNYTAYLTYRGQEESLTLHHYEVTAHYAGELVSSTEQLLVTGIYNPEEEAVTPAVVISEPGTPTTAEIDGNLVPLALTATTIVVLLALPLLYLFLLTNARLIRVEGSATQGNSSGGSGQKSTGKTGKTKLVCRRRLSVIEGEAIFRIPPKVDIMSGDTFYLVVKPRLACKEGAVRLTWQGKTVAVVPLQKNCAIDFQEMLKISVEVALRDMETNESSYGAG